MIKLCSTDGNILVDENQIITVVDQGDTRVVKLKNGDVFEVSEELETIFRRIKLGYIVIRAMGAKPMIVENIQ